MRRVALLLPLLSASLTLAAERADAPYPTASPAWTLRLEQPVRWQHVHPMGALLVATDACVYGVDTAKGAVAWSRCALEGPAEETFEVLQGTPLFLVSSGKL